MTAIAKPVDYEKSWNEAYDRYTDQQLRHYDRVAASPEGRKLYRKIVRMAQTLLATYAPREREVFLAFSAAAGILPDIPETILTAYETMAAMLNGEAAHLKSLGAEQCQEPEGLPVLLALGDFLRLHKIAVGLSFYPHNEGRP